MNPELPPELAVLEAQLVQLMRQVDAGALTPAQAQPTLDTMFTFDADGNRWTVSPATRPPDTTFLVAPPGGQPRRALPSQFRRPGPAPAPQVGVGGIGAAPPFAQGPQPGPGPQAGPQPGAQPGWGEPAPAEGREPRKLPSLPSLPSLSKLREVLPAAGTGRRGPMGARTRTIVTAAVAAVAVLGFVAVQRSNKPSAPTTTTVPGAVCAPVDPPVSGLPQDLAPQANCLAVAGQPSMLAAALGQEGGQYVFYPDEKMSRPWVLYAAGVLYRTGGGAPSADHVQVDLSQVPPEIAQGVQVAVDAGLASPEAVGPGDITRGEAAALLAGVYQKLNRTPPSPPVRASDAPAGTQGDAQATVAAFGASDTAPGAPYRFGDPLTTTAYTAMWGHALQGLAGTALASPPTSAAAAGEGPSSDRVAAVLEALQSGDRTKAASVVASPDDETTRALQTAYFAGFRASGLKLASGPVARSGEQLVSELTVTGGGTKYATGRALWVRDGDTWKVVDWPGMSRAG